MNFTTGAVVYIIFFFYFLCAKVNRIWLINSIVKSHHVQRSTHTCVFHIASMVFAPLTIAWQRERCRFRFGRTINATREALQQQRTWWIPDLFKFELMYTPLHYLHRSIMNAAPDYELIEAPQGHLMSIDSGPHREKCIHGLWRVRMLQEKGCISK